MAGYGTSSGGSVSHADSGKGTACAREGQILWDGTPRSEGNLPEVLAQRFFACGFLVRELTARVPHYFGTGHPAAQACGSPRRSSCLVKHDHHKNTNNKNTDNHNTNNTILILLIQQQLLLLLIIIIRAPPASSPAAPHQRSLRGNSPEMAVGSPHAVKTGCRPHCSLDIVELQIQSCWARPGMSLRSEVRNHDCTFATPQHRVRIASAPQGPRDSWGEAKPRGLQAHGAGAETAAAGTDRAAPRRRATRRRRFGRLLEMRHNYYHNSSNNS